MKIKKNSFLGWTILILSAALMGWFVGYAIIPNLILAGVFGIIAPAWVKVILAVGIGSFYLYCYRSGFDTSYPFKNGGWFR